MKKFASLVLPDSRKLNFAEFGIQTGHPVFFFHGSPSSHLEALLLGDQVFSEYNLRVVAPDRPGMGGSDFQKNRGFTDWTTDVQLLADHLGIEKFSVLGNSGGGGYVAACAAKIPDRLHSAAVTAGAWRMDLPIAKKFSRVPFTTFWGIAAKTPQILPSMFSMMRALLKLPKKKVLQQLQKTLHSADIAALLKDDRIKILSRALTLGAKSTSGAAWDIQMYVRDWDFAPDEVSFPITYFHGGKDQNVPLQFVEKMVGLVPGATLVPYERDAHFSVVCNHFDEIAQALLKKNA